MILEIVTGTIMLYKGLNPPIGWKQTNCPNIIVEPLKKFNNKIYYDTLNGFVICIEKR